MQEPIEEPMIKSFSGKILGGIIKATFFNKPIKDKIVHVEIGSIEHSLFPDENEIADLTETLNAIVKADPEKFSNTAFLVTGPYVKFKTYDVAKLKKRMTTITIGSDELFVEGSEYEKLKQDISNVFEQFKITSKYFITNWPIRMIRAKKTTDAKTDQ